ncbi:MAG: tRNA pseudouridine(13) synthase TruD [Magnetococcales bacterium]|nr:tRNA pseudouridine(13) synthase TruD [Magnetococcales bacterium]MBF0322999.1 tRNA pseudouridine(13) synthase TruD [Magnetococcales bacterium]
MEKNVLIQPDLPLASPGAGLGGEIKTTPETFQVTEIRPEQPDGNGEHWILTVERSGMTTEQVVDWLARSCASPRAAIGYAGLKDRWSLAVQAFSVHLPQRELPDLTPLLPAGLRILDAVRHRRKIRIGHLSGNHFRIFLSGAQCTPQHQEGAAMTAAWIKTYGFPNFFGPQRFGRAGDNVQNGLLMLAGEKTGGNRKQRGLYLSAVRSELFNQVLAKRLTTNRFTQLLDGDVAQLQGRSACFVVQSASLEQPRFAAGEIHPTGPLFGRSLLQPSGEPGNMEADIARTKAEAVTRLTEFSVQGERRALRVIPTDLTLTWEKKGLWLQFSLPRGAYATSLLREFMQQKVGEKND